MMPQASTLCMTILGITIVIYPVTLISLLLVQLDFFEFE